MNEVAEAARGQPDARVGKLNRLDSTELVPSLPPLRTTQTQGPPAKWNENRVLIFTEYKESREETEKPRSAGTLLNDLGHRLLTGPGTAGVIDGPASLYTEIEGFSRARTTGGITIALQEFWNNVRIGARLIAPQVVADAPRLDPASIESALRRATFWFTPRAVEGFNEADFLFLPKEERERLAKLVNEFSEVAAKVSLTDAAPREAVESALPLFREILQMLEFHRYGDAEAFRLGKQIERKLQPHWPKEIAELRFNTGLDHTGDPALWIWVFLTDDVSKDDETFLRAAQRLPTILDPIARRVAPDRWPYLSFRPITEPAEAVEAS